MQWADRQRDKRTGKTHNVAYWDGHSLHSHKYSSLSLLQAGLDPSGEGSATRVLPLHSALFSMSSKSSCKSSMLYFTTSIHFFLCLPLLRCPRTSASKILLTQSSSSLPKPSQPGLPYSCQAVTQTLSVNRHSTASKYHESVTKDARAVLLFFDARLARTFTSCESFISCFSCKTTPHPDIACNYKQTRC